VLGTISDVDSWNEYVSRQSFAGNLLRRVYLRLAQEPGDGQQRPEDFAPLLAESWEASDDGRALTFRLREASWSDGMPITAVDVRYTWQAQTSDEVPWIGAESKSHINDVVVLDERTVRFEFDAAYPFQLADAVEGGILPQHRFADVPFERWATHDWSAYRVGSGPFLLERHTPGQEIVLVRNPRYFGEAPLLDRVVVRVIPDIASLITQLRTGEVDYVEPVPPRDAAGLRQAPGITLVPFDYPGYDYIGWNGARAPFDEPAMRRALTQAIDRDALVDDLLFGYGRVSRGPLLSFWRGADEELQPWPYQPQTAREFLAARGFPALGERGAVPASKHPPLAIELLTNSGNRLREDMLVKIQEQLSRIGVRVDVRPMEMRALRQKVAAGDYDAYLGGWVYSIKDLRSVFSSAAVFPHGGNVVGYASAEADELLDRIDDATDWAAMEEDLRRLQRRIHEDQPYTFLYENRRLAAHGPRLGGVVIDVPSDPLARLERFWVR